MTTLAYQKGLPFYDSPRACLRGHIGKRNKWGQCLNCLASPAGRAKKVAAALKWRKANPPTAYQSMLVDAKKRAKRKGIPYNLTSSWAKNRWTGKCEWSGIPFDLSNKKSPKAFSPSLDKINPSLGYIQSNCRFILFALNSLKWTATDEEVLLIIKAISR